MLLLAIKNGYNVMEDVINLKFNERVKLLRLEMGVTQRELGDLIGVGRTTISEYESGKIVPKQEGLIALSKVFNVSIDYLTGISDSNLTTLNDVSIDETILKLIKTINNKMEFDDQIKIKYLDVDLNNAQLQIIKAQLESTVNIISQISKMNV